MNRSLRPAMFVSTIAAVPMFPVRGVGYAQTRGMERCDDRHEDRGEARDIKVND